MIHARRTVQIAPGRQAEMVGCLHEFGLIWKDAGVDLRCSEVTTGTLGRMCGSADFENMAAFEAARAKIMASPKAQAFSKKFQQSERDGTSAFISNTEHEKFWRDV